MLEKLSKGAKKMSIIVGGVRPQSSISDELLDRVNEVFVEATKGSACDMRDREVEASRV